MNPQGSVFFIVGIAVLGAIIMILSILSARDDGDGRGGHSDAPENPLGPGTVTPKIEREVADAIAERAGEQAAQGA